MMTHTPTVIRAPRLARSGPMVAATVLGLLLVGWLLPAGALPPGGASSDTEGTAGSVSPTSLRAGAVIRFSVSGFPAGETVNVKIDDGEFCSDKSVHGACVVHQQRIDASGRVSGSFALPADIGVGEHWLRFLASEELVDGEGRYVGVKPYSLRGNANFTVVAAGGEANGAKRAGDSGSSRAGGSGPADGSGVETNTGSPSATRTVDGSATASTQSDGTTLRIPVPPASAGGVPADGSGDPTADDPPLAQNDLSASRRAERPFPYVGAGVLLAAVVVAGLLALRSRTVRTRSRV